MNLPIPAYIDPAILTVRFACDIAQCKGACCTFPGGLGAPILPSEVGILNTAWQIVKDRVPSEHVTLVERDGLFERHGGTLHLRCHAGRACVFVAFRNGIAVCAIQDAYQESAIAWPKPISCHLFPIRISNGKDASLRFEHFDECEPAIERGNAEGIPLTEFVEDALQRAFGIPFTLALRDSGSADQESMMQTGIA